MRIASDSRNLFLAGITGILFLAPAAMAQNLIADPSFELGSVPNCNQGSVPSTWYAFSVTPDVYSFDCATRPGLAPTAFGNFTSLTAAHDGLRFMAGGAVTGLTESYGQTLAAPLLPGQTYRVGAAFTVANSRPEPAVYDVYLSDVMSETSPNAVLVASLGAAAAIGTWTLEEATFVAPASAASLTEFLLVPRSIGPTINSYPGSDGWVLEATSPVPVPLLGPGAIGLVMGGLVRVGCRALEPRRS